MIMSKERYLGLLTRLQSDQRAPYRQYADRKYALIDKASADPEKKRKKFIELTSKFMGNWGDTPQENAQGMREFCAAMAQEVEFNLYPVLIGAPFTEFHGLGPADYAAFRDRTIQLVRYMASGAMGGSMDSQWVPQVGVAAYPMTMYTSEISWIEIFDPTLGPLNEFEKARDEIVKDGEVEYDKRLIDFVIANCLGTFPAATLSGLHRAVDSTKVPTTNIIDLSAEGSINQVVFKAALLYFAKISQPTKEKFPTVIFVPVDDLDNIWDWAAVTSGYAAGSQQPEDTISAKLKDNIEMTGTLQRYMGQQFVVVPTNHISLPSNSILIAGNEAAAHVWTKAVPQAPTGVRIIDGETWPGDEHVNERGVRLQRAYSIATNNKIVPNVLKIIYKT